MGVNNPGRSDRDHQHYEKRFIRVLEHVTHPVRLGHVLISLDQVGAEKAIKGRLGEDMRREIKKVYRRAEDRRKQHPEGDQDDPVIIEEPGYGIAG